MVKHAIRETFLIGREFILLILSTADIDVKKPCGPCSGPQDQPAGAIHTPQPACRNDVNRDRAVDARQVKRSHERTGGTSRAGVLYGSAIDSYFSGQSFLQFLHARVGDFGPNKVHHLQILHPRQLFQPRVGHLSF